MDQRDLPEPEILAIPPTTPVTRGWWEDPFETLQITQQRFHDGVAWTPYVVYLRGGLWSDIVEDPFFDDIPPV